MGAGMLGRKSPKLRTEAEITAFVSDIFMGETESETVARELALVLMAENRIRGVFKKGTPKLIRKVLAAQAKVLRDASVQEPQAQLVAKFCKSVMVSTTNGESLNAAASLLDRITSLRLTEPVLMNASRVLIERG